MKSQTSTSTWGATTSENTSDDLLRYLNSFNWRKRVTSHCTRRKTSPEAELDKCHLVNLNACCLTDPRVVSCHSSVDAILPILGTLLPPADDACQEPCAFVIGGMWPSAVPLTWILQFGLEAGAEHEACDVFPTALLTPGALHVRDLQLLEHGGFEALEPNASPAADQRAAGLPQQVLDELSGAQADGASLVGQLHRFGEF